ncbi:MAG: hypothetical protein GX772_13585 [Alcaligenaceae bacterium]|nr:hypothetical protein [Alcaligenaceae bacterium]
MFLKNILAALVLGGVLAGCASTGNRSVQADDLRKEETYLITDTVISELDFPALQRNLFQHRAACGSAPRFVMHEGETAYASLFETADTPESYEDVVIADLIQYPDSWRAPMRVAISFYSYYNNSDVQQRVAAMLGAVRSPGVCM